MLNWSTSTLTQYQDEPLKFKETVDIKQDLMSRNADILDLAAVLVDGYVFYSRGDFAVNVTITTTVTLPSTRSLTPVQVPLHFTYDEVYLTNPAHADQYDEDDLVLPLAADHLDLLPSVGDNLLLALPSRVLTAEEQHATTLPSGDGWGLITDEEYAKQQQAAKEARSPFAKLAGMFDDSDDDANKK
ncbi:DUF177 domain-containing protein [Lacticaseibacillus thailandensis]|uniref:Metal-binding protein n=1 Tax=Lacticaseibacillus thailandensis DSM 22698 = JCM 13996 TaxID=1423810 RepID=A0A0R2CJ44_9LACO|nr:YceD family protein [Lacticaseibacillus thailandensis]KRM88300.1 metal-binding protein [Lacticaseibacillus thailandensis DSM 22698 = JCM 13996]